MVRDLAHSEKIIPHAEFLVAASQSRHPYNLKHLNIAAIVGMLELSPLSFVAELRAQLPRYLAISELAPATLAAPHPCGPESKTSRAPAALRTMLEA